jgi:hypothetical protein
LSIIRNKATKKPGFEIQDPEKLISDSDPGAKKAPDPGSATQKNCVNVARKRSQGNQKTILRIRVRLSKLKNSDLSF